MEYLLVRFIGDDILHIVPTKKVSTINEELVHAPYKRMGYYEARPIEYSDDKNYLEKKKEVLEEQASEDNRNEEHHEDSDDSVKDPDYEPEEGRTEIYKAKSLLQESSAEAKNIQPIQHIAVKHVSGNPDMDYKELELFDTECKSKRHFCIYCKTLHTKFARHLELKHKDEVNVKQFLSLEKKSSLRKKIINDIRVQGDYMYNTSKDYNQNKHLIVVRRPKRGLDVSKKSGDFKPCGNCGGMYSAKSLIQHYRKCMKDRMKGSKDVLFSSKRKSLFISSEVMPVLRNEVLTKLKNDAITETILADPLIILFGNRLCQKYRSPHLHKMIRARLRCVARFVITIKAIQEKINKLEDCYDPEFYDDVIKAINDMCGLNINDGRYKAPATAFAVGSYLMKISFYLTTEYIKRKDYVAQKNIKRFIHLLKDGLSHDVYKTVQENQLEMNRRKKTDLPGLEDIQRLSCYLEKCRKKHYENLEKNLLIMTLKN
ncbi:unnamed protein product [Callosobruchus maculatus]|uniref:Uncharacterized protein n=1 Tax=Callosobruchus maculatus TaxID=64391 RepID=A0A653CQY4_CALMS|nr:unnamed protein product [Callosobruchus maculatus]VEN50351.1 unnamed protein product [Callosobruchus maculatus]